MEKKRRLEFGKITAATLFLLAVFFVWAVPVRAAGTRALDVTVEVDQSSARDMLAMVNDFRSGPDAWYWNDTDTAKVYVTGAPSLTWDYNLEQIAIQRALEAAVSFSHTRPDGTSCWTCTYNGISSSGECLAAGSSTAEGAYYQWREDDDNHAGQGHRRLMLGKGYNAIGIGHVVYNGVHFWSQEFGNSNSGAPSVAPVNETRTMTVNVNTNNASFKLVPEDSYLRETFGNVGTVPALTGYYEFEESWGSNGAPVPSTELSGITWTSATPDVVAVSGSTYEIVGTGNGTLIGSAVFGGNTYSCEVDIQASQLSISDSRITVTTNSPVIFTPDSTIPMVSVQFDGKILTEGTDYTLSFSYNYRVTDQARITISGKGNFYGTRYEYFSIVARSIDDITFDDIPDMTYTGSAIRISSITGTVEGKTVKSGTNFTISSSAYSNNTNVGTASVTVTGNETYGFVGEKTLTFKIIPKDIAETTISAISGQPYTGSEITPSLTVRNGYYSVNKDTDYDVSYSNNVEIGTATVTITGKGNFTGTQSATFEITKVPVSKLSCTGLKYYYSYTSEAITPEFQLTYNSWELTKGTDYTVQYSDNMEPGTGSIIITGKGIYDGTRTITFRINGRAISNATMSTIPTQYYTGDKLTPAFTLTDTLAGNTFTLTEGVDYTVTYGENTQAGEYLIITVSGIGHYSSTRTLYSRIYARNINELSFSTLPDVYYTGQAVTPDVTIKHGNKTLVKDTDYTVSISGNVNAGTATYRVIGKGNYNSSKTLNFKILPKPLSDLTLSTIANQGYTGSAIKPDVTIKNGTTVLVNNTDYTLTYSNNTNVGTATVTATGKGNYTGTRQTTFKITQKDLSEVNAGTVGSLTYNGSAQSPALTLMNGTIKLIAGTDYTVAYSNNVNAGTATATVTGKGNYKGQKTVNYTINPKSVGDLTLSTLSNVTYNGSAYTPDVVLKDETKTLVKGTDYTLGYSGNTNAGTATVTITGKGNYGSSRTTTFKISPKNVSTLTVGTLSNVTYSGSAFQPAVTVKDGTKTLTLNTDYTVSYSNNTNAGTATVTITGKGNYTSVRNESFVINAKDVNSLTLTAPSAQTYTGSALMPDVTLKDGTKTLVKGTDYTLSYSGNTNVGTATVTITGKGNYAKTRSTAFKINAKNASGLTIATIPASTYMGSAITPKLTVTDGTKTLTLNTDYTVSYSNNVNAGTATATITGKGNYTATKSATFTISAKNVNSLTLSDLSNVTYNGSAYTPDVVLKDGTKTLVKGTDYTLGFSGNTNAGTATVTITGKGNYGSSRTTTFKISPKNVSTLTVGALSNVTYSGSAFQPAVTVKDGTKTLTLNTDYTVSYSNNTNAGTATVSITGKGNYTSVRYETFVINAKDINSLTLTAPSAQTYTGSALKPDVTLKDGTKTLVKGTDYTLAYSGNTNAGTATVTITGKGNYAKTRSTTFKINAKNASGLTIATIPSATYTGSAITPKLTVTDGTKTLTLNTDYTVSYSNNVNAGTATATITGKGNYTATKSATFTISAKNVNSLTLSDLANVTYNGSAYTPDVVLKDGTKTLVKGTDYTLSYSGNTNAGTATVTITGKGNYGNTRQTTFKINAKNASGLTIATIPAATYTGSAITPTLTVKDGTKTLTLNTDYTVSYSNNTNSGTATATITGKGNYTATKSANFTINKKSVADLTYSSVSSATYTGSAITPALTVKYGSKTLVSGTDYTIAYASNVNAGTATITVTGKGNFDKSKTINFTINAKDLSSVTAEIVKSVVYNGKAQTPAPVLKNGSTVLQEGTDYTLAYKDNTEIGTATVTATGKGNYGKTKVMTFEIADKSHITGFHEYAGGLFFFNDGDIVVEANGLIQDPDHRDDWYFCAKGKVQTQKSGLVQYPAKSANWFYIQNGKLDTTYNGKVTYDGGEFFVARGKILTTKNGLFQDPNNKADWYFLANGQVQLKKTGIAIYNGAGFYVVNGKLASTYTGKVTDNGTTYNVVKGRVV